MATYMYISATGSNWDDDDSDDDIDTEVHKTAAEFSISAPNVENLAPLQWKPAVEDRCKVTQFTAPAPSKSGVDYDDVDPECRPNYSEKMTELWFYNERRPAYVELSHENGYPYPHQRTSYNANWIATKLHMGANTKFPMMMKPSPLKLSMTWEQDSKGEYVKEGGFLFPSLLSPTLVYDSHSKEERDKASTPPGPPSMVQATQCKDEVKGVSDTVEIDDRLSTDIAKYDPITGVIDLSSHSIKAMEIDMSHGFAEFSHIVDDLDVEDILSGAASNMERIHINKLTESSDLGPTEFSEPVLVATLEKNSSVTEEFRHDQTDMPKSYTLTGSSTRSNTDEKAYEFHAGSSYMTDERCICYGSVAHVMSVSITTHSLVKIVKKIQVSDFELEKITLSEISEVIKSAAGTTANPHISENHISVQNTARCPIEFTKKAQATVWLSKVSAEATHIITSEPESQNDDKATSYTNLQAHYDRSASVLEGFKPLMRNPTYVISGSSPDLRYTQDFTNTSLIWNTISACWFALSSVPWPRVAATAAGALIDVVAFVARR